MSDDYEERRAKRREEERQYQADVAYEVWRAGRDPDRVDPDRVSDSFWQGIDADAAARRELRAQQPKPPQPSEEEWLENGGEQQ